MRAPFLISVSVIALLTLAGKGSATTEIPGHGTFADDDGTELWIPADPILAFEYFENPAVTGSSSFGFYFSTDPGTLITVFGTEDWDLSSDGSDPQEARIDFGAGQVLDLDDSEVQSSFSDLGAGIGFWFRIDDTETLVVFTESSLTGDSDFAYSLPSLSDPDKYALVFFVPEGGDTPIAVNVAAGIAPIPEPSTALLFAFGLAGLALGRGRGAP